MHPVRIESKTIRILTFQCKLIIPTISQYFGFDLPPHPPPLPWHIHTNLYKHTFYPAAHKKKHENDEYVNSTIAPDQANAQAKNVA